MPVRSSIEKLPDEIRRELNEKLIGNSFSGYDDLSSWLQEKGFNISRSAIHRYGKDFEDRLEALRIATEQARAIAETTGDESNFMGDALIRIFQQKIFDLLLKLEVDGQEYDLAQLSKMISQMNATSIDQKKYMDEVRKRTKDVAGQVEESLKREAGISDEFAATIRQKILEITV